MNYSSILSYVGTVLEIMGVLFLLPIIISIIFQQSYYMPFLVAGLASFALGTVLERKFQKDQLDLASAMMITTLTFLIVALFGIIPYLDYLSPFNAFFESVSGFTTTGLTVVEPESLPPSILFWRSLTQWIGGIGILVIFILLMASPGISSYYLYKAEGKPTKIEASVKHSVMNIFKIYGVYTVIGIILLYITGMPVFDAVLHTFTSLSTGGFSTKNASVAAFSSPWIHLVLILLMMLGGTSFFVHDKLLFSRIKSKSGTLRKRIFNYANNPETKLFWVLIAVFSILVVFSFLGIDNFIKSGIFETVSAITTTGYTTLNVALPEISKFLLILLMIIGGYAGSTAGGIKLVRFGIIAKSFPWLGKKMSLPPEAVIPFKYAGKTIKESELTIISFFVSVYIMLLVIGATILMFLGYSPLDSFFQMASAQGTVGFSTVNIAAMPVIGKLVLIIGMLVGRLEIFPVMAAIYSIFFGIRKMGR